LGNVKVVFNDYKEPVSSGSGSEKYDLNVLSLLNYYPFGMSMPGMGYEAGGSRYGFNGMEKDDAIAGVGNIYTTPFRPLDVRLGRWWMQDPIFKPYESSFVGFGNNPIMFVDPSGLAEVGATSKPIEGSKQKKMRGKTLGGVEIWAETGKIYHKGKAISKDEFDKKVDKLVNNYYNDDYDPSRDGFNENEEYGEYFNKTFKDKFTSKYGTSREAVDKEGKLLGLNPYHTGDALEDNSLDLALTFWGGGGLISKAGSKAVVKTTGKEMAEEIGESIVYLAYKNGKPVYVGITDNFKRRAYEQFKGKGIEIEEFIVKLSREDARAVEQVLIERYGLQKHGGSLMNRINSISNKNPIYARSLLKRKRILDKNGY